MPRHLKQAIASSSHCTGKLGVRIQFGKMRPYSVNHNQISAGTLFGDGHKYNVQLWKGLRTAWLTHTCISSRRICVSGMWSAGLPAWPRDQPPSALDWCCFSIRCMYELHLQFSPLGSSQFWAGMGCFHLEKKLREKPGGPLPRFPSYPQELQFAERFL